MRVRDEGERWGWEMRLRDEGERWGWKMGLKNEGIKREVRNEDWLDGVGYIRLILIIFLVFLHVFSLICS